MTLCFSWAHISGYSLQSLHSQRISASIRGAGEREKNSSRCASEFEHKTFIKSPKNPCIILYITRYIIFYRVYRAIYSIKKNDMAKNNFKKIIRIKKQKELLIQKIAKLIKKKDDQKFPNFKTISRLLNLTETELKRFFPNETEIKREIARFNEKQRKKITKKRSLRNEKGKLDEILRNDMIFSYYFWNFF
ncbi:hypothetical protein AB3N58_01850 [Leptospira sp. WS60.C2]